MLRNTLVATSTILTLFCASASAQPAAEPFAAEQPAAEQPASAQPAAEQLAAPAALAVQDGPRFRWGISGGGGIESVSVVSGAMFGADCRLGLQLNDLLGFYAQAHLSLGSLSGEAGGIGITGFTGTFTAAGIAEVTLMDRFFAGAGVGYGVLNNPSGFMFQARVGGYPLMSRAINGIRRKGLMVGADLRTIFVNGATGILVLGSIGYEAF